MEPINKFTEWLQKARNTPAIADATAMALATTTKAGLPACRMVLLKSADEKGFTFFTNLQSRKGEELKNNPRAALCFYWMPLERQVRIEGKVEKVNDAEADAYFASRPRESQLGAWASSQSMPLASPAMLAEKVRQIDAQYKDQPIPRPPHWSGWRVVPDNIEFWEARPHRLHHRERFIRTKDGWKMELLYP